MFALNLPQYEIKLSGDASHPRIFDSLRRRYVRLTPEEWVRQHFVHYLTDHLGYPSALLANEVNLRCGDKQLRADSVLYRRDMQAQMIIEYKAPDVELNENVVNQALSYNTLLHVDYIIVSNGLRHFCFKIDYQNGKYDLLQDIPAYSEL